MWSIRPENMYRFALTSPTGQTYTVASYRPGVLYSVSLVVVM